MIWAPISWRWAGVTALTVPWVPTGMKAGVSMAPWTVASLPRRAAVAESVLRSWKADGLRFGVAARQRRAPDLRNPECRAFGKRGYDASLTLPRVATRSEERRDGQER